MYIVMLVKLDSVFINSINDLSQFSNFLYVHKIPISNKWFDALMVLECIKLHISTWRKWYRVWTMKDRLIILWRLVFVLLSFPFFKWFRELSIVTFMFWHFCFSLFYWLLLFINYLYFLILLFFYTMYFERHSYFLLFVNSYLGNIYIYLY